MELGGDVPYQKTDCATRCPWMPGLHRVANNSNIRDN